MLGYVDGSVKSPEMFLTDEIGQVTTVINPEFQAWEVQDQALITLINAMLSSTTLFHVVGFTIAREV